MGKIRNFEKMQFMPFKKRIGNLSVTNFYLDEDGVPKSVQSHLANPPFSYFEILKHEPNPYYGREEDYILEGDYYLPKTGHSYKIHKSCFVHPESAFMVAHWEDINHDECTPDLKFVGRRPFDLSPEEREAFWELTKLGQEHLENILAEFESKQEYYD
jgi:hypothetical protein